MNNNNFKLDNIDNIFQTCPLNGNHLRDKYPNVDFKDEDIAKYDYSSYKRHNQMLQQFVNQYNVKDLQIRITNHNKHFEQNLYFYGIEFEEYNGKLKFNFKDIKAIFQNQDMLNYNFDHYAGINLQIDAECKDFKLELTTWSNSNFNVELIINPEIFTLENHIDTVLERVDGKIYKYQHRYFIENYSIEPIVDVYFDGKDKQYTSTVKFVECIEPFKIYTEDGIEKKLSKKSVEISKEQLRFELIHLYSNCFHEDLNFHIYEPKLPEMYKDLNFKLKLRQKDRNYNNTYSVIQNKTLNPNINYTKIFKKDNFIGHYESFEEIDDNTYSDFYNTLEEIYGDEFDMNILSSLEYFVYQLKIDVEENMVYSTDYYLYHNAVMFGDYKLEIHGFKYIKDQSICNLEVAYFKLYKV